MYFSIHIRIQHASRMLVSSHDHSRFMNQTKNPQEPLFTVHSKLIMLLHLDGDLFNRVPELVNLLDLPRDLTAAGLFDRIQLGLVRVGWKLRVNRWRRFHGCVSWRGLGHAE